MSPDNVRRILKNAGSWGFCKSHSESKLDKKPENINNITSQFQLVMLSNSNVLITASQGRSA